MQSAASSATKAGGRMRPGNVAAVQIVRMLTINHAFLDSVGMTSQRL
jgi:hypothetical protein